MKRFFENLKNTIFYPNARRGDRTQDLVKKTYEKIYSVPNDGWLKKLKESKQKVKNLFTGKEETVSKYFLKEICQQELINRLKLLKPKKVLEVGCGRGDNIITLAKEFPNISFIGLELAEEGYKRCLEMTQDSKLKNVSFIHGDALKPPLEDKSIDFSFTVFVLEQMPYDYPKVLKEMKRITKDHCLFIEPFKEANNLADRLYLKSKDYFRFSYKKFEDYGFHVLEYQPIAFKKNFGMGLLVVKCI